MIKQLLVFGTLFTSLVGQAQTQIYLEDFNNGIPATYTIVDNDGLTPAAATAEFTDAWISLPDPLDSTDTIVGSTSYFSPKGTANRWLITPQITLGAFGNILYWDARSHDPSFPDGYFIFASTTDTQLSSFTDTLFVVGQELATWTENSVNLSDFGLDNQQVYLAFVNRTYDGFKLYLDSISVFVEDPVGISENTMANIQMSPNPSNGQVHFNVSVDLVSVYASSGQLQATFENVTSMDISNLPAGMYWVSIQEGAYLTRKKLVKL